MNHHATLVRHIDPASFEYESDDGERVHKPYERLGVDEARDLQNVAHLRPQHAGQQTIVITAQSVTLEAQNALLKLFEEPPTSTQFVLVVPPTLQLLPTLLSRLTVLDEVSTQTAVVSPVWQEFLSASYAERLKQIDTYQKKKDVVWLQAVHQGFILWCKESTLRTKNIVLVAERLNTRGASNKMLLELLSLELPTQ